MTARKVVAVAPGASPAKASAKAPAKARLAKPVLLPIETQLQRSLLASLLIAAFCVTMTLFVYFSKRQDILLSHNTEGALFALPYHDQPQMSSEAITNWAVQAVAVIYNYDMNNIEQRLLEAGNYFTEKGWQSFVNALEESDFVSSVKSGKQVVTSVTTGTPLILWEDTKNGIHSWGVSVSIRSSIDTGRGRANSETYTLTLTIEEIPTRKSYGGYALGIAKIRR